MEQRQQLMDMLISLLEEIALKKPNEFAMYVAESNTILAVNQFTEEEISSFDTEVNRMINQYLGGYFPDINIKRSNTILH